MWDRFLHVVFGGDTPEQPLAHLQIAARSAVIYLAGLVIVRAGKSRLVGRVTSLDILLGFILGSLLSRGITGHASLSGTVTASAAIVCAHWLFTLAAVRSHALGTLIKGRASLVVEEGRPLTDNLRRSHLSMHDLEEGLRLHGVEDLEEVRRAYKERNGEISVIKRKSS